MPIKNDFHQNKEMCGYLNLKHACGLFLFFGQRSARSFPPASSIYAKLTYLVMDKINVGAQLQKGSTDLRQSVLLFPLKGKQNLRRDTWSEEAAGQIEKKQHQEHPSLAPGVSPQDLFSS